MTTRDMIRGVRMNHVSVRRSYSFQYNHDNRSLIRWINESNCRFFRLIVNRSHVGHLSAMASVVLSVLDATLPQRMFCTSAIIANGAADRQSDPKSFRICGKERMPVFSLRSEGMGGRKSSRKTGTLPSQPRQVFMVICPWDQAVTDIASIACNNRITTTYVNWM